MSFPAKSIRKETSSKQGGRNSNGLNLVVKNVQERQCMQIDWNTGKNWCKIISWMNVVFGMFFSYTYNRIDLRLNGSYVPVS